MHLRSPQDVDRPFLWRRDEPGRPVLLQFKGFTRPYHRPARPSEDVLREFAHQPPHEIAAVSRQLLRQKLNTRAEELMWFAVDTLRHGNHASIIDALLASCRGKVSHFKSLLQELQKRGIAFDQDHYATVIEVLASSYAARDLETMVRFMEKARIRIRPASIDQMLRVAIFVLNEQDMCLLVETLHRFRLISDASLDAAVARAAASGAKLVGLQPFMREIMRHGYRLHGEAVAEHVLASCGTEEQDEAVTFWCEQVAAGHAGVERQTLPALLHQLLHKEQPGIAWRLMRATPHARHDLPQSLVMQIFDVALRHNETTLCEEMIAWTQENSRSSLRAQRGEAMQTLQHAASTRQLAPVPAAARDEAAGADKAVYRAASDFLEGLDIDEVDALLWPRPEDEPQA